MTPFFFETITVALPLTAIYRRLGYRRDATRISPEERREVDRYIDEAQEMIHLQGCALRLSCRIEQSARVILPGGEVMESRQLARFLKEAREAVIMGATAGSAIMAAISTDVAGRNVTRGVVLDAAASEIVDAALDWIMSYYSQILRREGKSLFNNRFSPGYGDFSLENQRLICRLLQMERLRVALTDSCLLVPEKSVTALTGVAAP